MKYLDNPKLAFLTSYLTAKEVGDAVLFGRLESLMCKTAPSDREQQKDLEAQCLEEFAGTPAAPARSSLGSMKDAATRKLMVNLIMTMNASFPDYDFSTLRADNFVVEESVDKAMTNINAALAELFALYEQGLFADLYAAIDEEISLRDAVAISYVSDSDDDPLAESALWSFNYFFYNRSTRKIVFFYCVAKNKFNYYASREPAAPTPTLVRSGAAAGAATALRISGRPGMMEEEEEEEEEGGDDRGNEDEDEDEDELHSAGSASTGSQGNIWFVPARVA